MLNLKLLQEFKSLNTPSIFKINIAGDLNLTQDEFYIFYLYATEEGINVTFQDKWLNNLFIEWDDYYNLDRHLKYLYEICNEWAVEDYENNYSRV